MSVFSKFAGGVARVTCKGLGLGAKVVKRAGGEVAACGGAVVKEIDKEFPSIKTWFDEEETKEETKEEK